MSAPRSTTHRILGAVTAAAVIVLAVALTPSAAHAADGSDGWLRLGHLSPDTKAVDVQVVAPGAAAPLLELTDVAYGDVSPYTQVPVGTYTVRMVPAGAEASTAPVVSSKVKIDATGATTVVAYGPTVDLEVKAIEDDLTPPAAGNARIRLMQASTLTDTVDVETSTGRPIAQDATAGTVTAYAEIPGGEWTLELSGADATGSTKVDVAPGSVVTLFVVDNAQGGLTILPVVDSAAVGTAPDGGVATGGGGTAPQVSGPVRTGSKVVPV